MLTIEKIDTYDKEQVRRFVRLPYRLYKDHPQWTPPLYMDAEMQLNRDKHPFYEHSEADFFVAVRDGEVVGRIAALEQRRYNEYHDKHIAQFYLVETEEDQEIANLLFERVYEWAQQRGLNQVMGPKGFAVLDGYGLLVEGYEYRQVMTMMNYNFAY